jgi:ActR/RegA family two-component response regulator
MNPFQYISDKFAKKPKQLSDSELIVQYNRLCILEFNNAYNYLHNAVHKNKPLGLYTYVCKNSDLIDMVLSFNKKKVDDLRYGIFKNHLRMFVDKVKKEHFSVTLQVTSSKVSFDFYPT